MIRDLEYCYSDRIKFHHYIVSSGFEPVIKGFLVSQGIFGLFEDIEASEFEDDGVSLTEIAKSITEEDKLYYVERTMDEKGFDYSNAIYV